MIDEVSRHLRSPYVLVPVALAVAVLLVTAGQAVFAASNQTISGCYYKEGAGFLKIVNGPAKCRNNEVAVTWNKTACSCGDQQAGQATFSNRRLWVRPAP